MSPLLGVFIISLVGSLLYKKFEENPEPKASWFDAFESMSATTDRSQSLDEGLNEHGHLKSFSHKIDENKEERLGNNLKDISDLDACVFSVVARNQQYCMEKSEENLSRLAIQLLHCQVKPEGTRLQNCPPEKPLSECSSEMDVADWMTFEILKKRALAVCQEVRQQLFVLNSQRRVQALMETAQLHTTFLMSFKDNQNLLANITLRTIARIHAQRRQFLKDMRQFQKRFIDNETMFARVAKMHVTHLAAQREIIDGIEKDINVLTEGFLQSLESMRINFTEFSTKIFQKHGEIMHNLDSIKATTDKILTQLELLEEYDHQAVMKDVFSWLVDTIQAWSTKLDWWPICQFFVILCLTHYLEMSWSLRLAVLMFVTVGMVVGCSPHPLFIASSVLLGPLNRLYTLLLEKYSSKTEPNRSESVESSSTQLTGSFDHLPTSLAESVRSNLESVESSSTSLKENRSSTNISHVESGGVRNITVPRSSVHSSRECGFKTLQGTPCRRRSRAESSNSRCYLHQE